MVDMNRLTRTTVTRADGVVEINRFHFDKMRDHIEALEAENERLREALKEVKRLLSYANQDAVNEAIAQANKNMAWGTARAALGESHDQ